MCHSMRLKPPPIKSILVFQPQVSQLEAIVCPAKFEPHVSINVVSKLDAATSVALTSSQFRRLRLAVIRH